MLYLMKFISKTKRKSFKRTSDYEKQDDDSNCTSIDRTSDFNSARKERAQSPDPVVKPLRLTLALDNNADNSTKKAQVAEKHAVCSLEDSPFYVFRASGQGLVDVVRALVDQDPTKITKQDNKGWTCLHHAASKARIEMIDFFIERGANIDALDDSKNTPLHIAVEKGKKSAVRHILSKGAKANILNSKKIGILHLAASLNKPDIITTIFSTSEISSSSALSIINPNLKGPNGATALHLACAMDYSNCVEALIKNGASVTQPDNNLFYPTHVAAKNASNKSLEVMLKLAVELGYSPKELLQFSDREKNTPLHSAVNGGDHEAVAICLRSGASCDARQEDKATAFHLACSQGTFSIVQLMLKHYRDEAISDEDILLSRDGQDMTPLHRAAMFDHPELVQFLIDSGSELDALDCERRSPLLLAALRGGRRSLKILLDAGASITIKDTFGRNILHFMVILGKPLIDEMMHICSSVTGKKLLDEKDKTGCTPVHLACQLGNLKLLEALVQLGASITAKNDEDRAPLHFAAKYGRLNAMVKLLESPRGFHIINANDSIGMTPLHIASMSGHDKVVQLLMYKGALLHKDFKGRTPLHLAAERGFISTMNLLLSLHKNLLDQVDKKGNTALHYATYANKAEVISFLLSYNCDYDSNDQQLTAMDICITNRFVDCAMAMIHHERWMDILDFPSQPYVSITLGLIQYLPDVHKVVLDRCVSCASVVSESVDYWKKFTFHHMQAAHRDIREKRKQLDETYEAKVELKPLLALNTMVKYGRVELLSHPVCLTYLEMKWKAYGKWIFSIDMLFFLIFIVCLTYAVINLAPHGSSNHIHQQISKRQINQTLKLFKKTQPPTRQNLKAVEISALVVVCIYAVASAVRHTASACHQRRKYFKQLRNFIEIIMISCSIIFVGPLLFTDKLAIMGAECATVATFLAWFNLLLSFQQLNSVGLYVVMFLHILNTVISVVLVFSVLFVAFGIAFYVLLDNPLIRAFKNPLLSTLTGVLMMMGDWNFESNFLVPMEQLSDSLTESNLSFAFLFLFVLLMPILFINLLIGLAVGDIGLVQKNAKLKRLTMQVDYHTQLEDQLPCWILERVDKQDVTKYPNKRVYSNWLSKLTNFLAVVASVFANRSDSNSKEVVRDALYEAVQVNRDCTMEMIHRIQTLEKDLGKQYNLLRLIVRKLQIECAVDIFDEGDDNRNESYSQQ